MQHITLTVQLQQGIEKSESLLSTVHRLPPGDSLIGSKFDAIRQNQNMLQVPTKIHLDLEAVNYLGAHTSLNCPDLSLIFSLSRRQDPLRRCVLIWNGACKPSKTFRK